MTAERWQQVKEIFQAVRERTAAERVAFLDTACMGDAELRTEVESLLAAHERPGDFMKRPLLATQPTAGPTVEQSGLESGRMIGHYRVERLLGTGGTGVVYLARDTRLGRPIALKLLKARFTRDDERIRRFQQEARAASALNHPNILTIHEIGEVEQASPETGGAHFIATEFVDGYTLRERLNHAGLQLGEALDMMIQAAGALSVAHEAGIVHRDIKPENIMVRRDGIVKVLDFGLAKLTERALHSLGNDITTVNSQPGIVMGTLNYMSPEQLRRQEVDARSDIFSLGVVIYEMLTGHLPFAGETTGDMITALLGDDPPPLAHAVPHLPTALQRIIDRVLAKPIEDRYQTARDLGNDLKSLKQELEFAAQSPQAAAVAARDALTMKVGAVAAATADYSTLASGDVAIDDARRTASAPIVDYTTRPAGRPTGQMPVRRAGLTGFLRRHRKAALLTLTMLILAAAGVLFGRQWFSPRGGEINSIAILPFVNVGNDPQMEYLPNGITENLIGSLSRLPSLTVMARSTVFTYKGREVDPRQVGAALKVRAVITGRVERQGERLIISAELVNAADGARLWGSDYKCPLTDIFSVQEEIARDISENLRPHLSGAERRQLVKRHTTNTEAYQLYLKGRYHFSQFNRASQEKALDYFQQAVALDPNYALAYTGIADIYADFSSQYLAPSEAMPKAKQAALQALAIDYKLAEAHHSLAMVKWFGDWDWAGAEAEFKRALDLNPNAGATYSFYADFLVQSKRFDEALAMARRGEELDPLAAHVSEMVSKSLCYLRRYDQSIEHSRKTLEFNPGYVWAYGQIALCLEQQGQYEEAIAELQRALEISRHDAVLADLACAYTLAGQRNEARRILAELEQQAKRRHVSPAYRARIYIGLGEKDRAIELLRQAYEEHSDHLLSLGVTPYFDGLRADPRFIQMQRGIGLVP